MKLQLHLQWLRRLNPVAVASEPSQSHSPLSQRIANPGEIVVVVQIEDVLAAHKVDPILDVEVFDHSSLTWSGGAGEISPRLTASCSACILWGMPMAVSDC